METGRTSLQGLRVLVTGGTTGIGRATVLMLAAEGARVLTFGRHEAELKEALGQATGDVFGLSADVSDPDDVARVFSALDDRLGGIDVLVANAALSADPLGEMDDDDWRYVVETNLVGYLACAKQALNRMQAQGGGHLVFVGSISSDVKVPGESVYAATKAGVAAFAETLRKEVADQGIRVTLIQPGTVGTDMQPTSPREQRDAIGREEMLPAEDIADAIRYVVTRSGRADIVDLRIEPRLQSLG